jgi:hypothetical protein
MGCCDKTTDSLGRFIANLAADKLDNEVPSNPHLVCSKVLRHTNNSTVARYANDGLRELWPTGVHWENVLILYSVVAAYMLKAETVLKAFYPISNHFTGLMDCKVLPRRL